MYIYSTYAPDRFVSEKSINQHKIHTSQFCFLATYFHSIYHLHLTSPNFTNGNVDRRNLPKKFKPLKLYKK